MNKHFRVLGRLPSKLQESGISVSAVLQRAGLPSKLLDQPRVLVSTEELFALWRGIGHFFSNHTTATQICSVALHDPFPLIPHPLNPPCKQSAFGPAAPKSLCKAILSAGL